MIYEAVGHYAEADNNGERADDDAWAARYMYLVAIGQKKPSADDLREEWKTQYVQRGRAPGEITVDPGWRASLGLAPAEVTGMLSDLLPYSFLISLSFRLRTPYTSRQDNDFHIIDNPLVREHVFRWPMVRPSAWKGSLRHAIWQLGYQDDNDVVQRVFGVARDTEGNRGRIFPHPTFFDQSGLEIINPHSRTDRVGKNPILLECVPPTAIGQFTLLYVPLADSPREREAVAGQVADDLEVLGIGIQAMLATYGFGAKTSSGFGSAEDQLVGEGKLAIRADLGGTSPAGAGEAESSGPQPDALTASIAQFLQRFSVPEFPRWTDSELGASGWGGTRASAYKRLRDSHPDWDRQGRTWIEREAVTAEAPPAPAAPPIGERAFAHLSDLPGVARQVADELRQGGAQ